MQLIFAIISFNLNTFSSFTLFPCLSAKKMMDEIFGFAE